MASGSSVGRANNSGSKGSFDFVSDDILCAYEDYDNHQDPSNGNHSDPVIGPNSSKDFQKSRVSRSSVFPTTNIYTQPEGPLNQEVMETVENTMKKYSDNLMRFLEGISSRLSQLELYCYNLDKSIGEMRSELAHDNKEADGKLKSLDKHLQEVHRSVQILRDKQELAETQKELAKLQLVHKESSRPQQEEKSSASESKKSEAGQEMHNQQLALALPHQVAPQPSLPSRVTEQQQQQQQPVSIAASSQNMTQQPPYYLPATQLPNPAAQPQPPQGPYAPADPQYRAPQMAPNPQQGQASQPPQVQQYPQYQQQWPQPVPQSTQPQLVQSQTQIRAPPTVYPTYIQNQPPQEQLTSSMPMQMPTPGVPQQGVSRADAVPYGYGGPGRPHQTQPPPQPMKGGDGYAAPGTHPPVSSGGSYMMYDGEGGRSHHPPQTRFSQGYPPSNTPLHNPQPPTSGGHMMRGPSPPQFVRNHPYSELIDKLVSMGYRGDHVGSVIQRLEETRQPVDFNTVLDRLNGHSSGGSQRSW